MFILKAFLIWFNAIFNKFIILKNILWILEFYTISGLFILKLNQGGISLQETMGIFFVGGGEGGQAKKNS